jgi:hypothetical protein
MLTFEAATLPQEGKITWGNKAHTIKLKVKLRKINQISNQTSYQMFN